MPAPAGLNRVRVYMLVRNSCLHDARVLKEADALARRGYVVTIVAVLRDGAIPWERRGSFTIVRVPIQPAHYRLLRRIRALPHWAVIVARSRRRWRVSRTDRRRRAALRVRGHKAAQAKRARDARRRARYTERARETAAQLAAARVDVAAAGGQPRVVGRARRPLSRHTRVTLRRVALANAGLRYIGPGLPIRTLAAVSGARSAAWRVRSASVTAGRRAQLARRRTVPATALTLLGTAATVRTAARWRVLSRLDHRPQLYPRYAGSAVKAAERGLRATASVFRTMTGRARRAARLALEAMAGIVVLPLKLLGLPVGALRRLIRPAMYGSSHWILMRFHRQFLLADYTKRALQTIEDELRRTSTGRSSVVIHAHDLNTLLAGRRARRRFAARLVYDSHELHLGTTGMVERSRLHQWHYRCYERVLVRRTDAVITVCQSIAEILKRDYALPRVDVVRNCPIQVPPLEPHDILRREFGIPADHRIALYHGNIAPMRGLEMLVRSAAYLDNVSVVFLGGGGLVDELGRLAAELGLSDRVHLHQPVVQHRLPRYIASADVAVVPIQGTVPNYYYSLPNKLFEAMMSGIPIAASHLPEIRRVVESERVGAIFDPEDPSDIARTVQEVLDSPDYDAMRERAREAARERHNWACEVESLYAIYGRILQQGPSDPGVESACPSLVTAGVGSKAEPGPDPPQILTRASVSWL